MRPGETIAGRFQVLGVARGGGLSVVVQARDLRSSESVALKVINLSAGGPELSKRIEREIQIHATFSHPNVVRCLGSGFLADHRPYLVLEWLEGRDLAAWMSASSMPLRSVLELGVQVSEALDAAHARGIVHRDIKPANIFLVRPERGVRPDVRVIDFGVAKMQEAASITRAGAILGTVSYMAPEQAGLATEVDARADIFSVGVVLFELITGRLPWTAPSDLARLARIEREPPLALRSLIPDVPETLAELVDSTLVLDPKARLGSARELAARLTDLLASIPAPRLARAFDDPIPTRRTDDTRAERSNSRVQARRSSRARAPSSPEGTQAGPSVQSASPRGETLPIELVREEATAGTVIGFGVDLTPEISDAGVLAVEPDVGDVAAHPAVRVSAPAAVERTARARRGSSDRPQRRKRGESRTVESPPATVGRAILPQAEDLSSLEKTPLSDGAVTQDLSAAEEPQGPEDDEPVLYGRVQELESIRGLALRLLEAVAAGFVLVVGPAGVGKTRVCLELRRGFGAAQAPPAVLLGRGDPLRSLSPYAFLRGLLLIEAGIRLEDTPAVQRAKLLRLVPSAKRIRALLEACEPALPGAAYSGAEPLGELWFARAGLGAEPPESLVDVVRRSLEPEGAEDEPLDEARAGLLVYLARALRIPGPKPAVLAAAERAPRRMGEQLRRAMDVVFRGIAELRRLVILADDAHWIDTDSARVLADLVKPARANQIVLLAFALPQLLEGPDSTSPLDGRRARVIELPPLDARAARAMVRGLLPGPIDASTLEGLVKRAAGNPLYLEQLVHAARTSGALALSASGEFELCHLPGDGTDEDLVPATVSGAVAARIGPMDAKVASALSAAAVLGGVFTSEGVASVQGATLEATDEALETLLAQGLLQRARAFGRAPGEFELTHAVIQSVALARLKRRKRHKLERAAVGYLETLAETEQAVLAAHLAQAGLDERAAGAFADAATAALLLGSAASALALAEQGVHITDLGTSEDATRLRLLALLERAATLMGDDETVERALAGLEGLAENDLDMARVQERRAAHAFRTQRWAQAAEAEKVAIEIYRRLEDSESEARALVWHGESSLKRRRPRAAQRSFLDARALLVDQGSSPELARANLGLARLALDSGDYRLANTRLREALAHAEAASHPESRFRASIGLAAVSRISGDVPRAFRRIESAAPFADTTERRLLLELERASVLSEEGNMDEAESLLVRILSVLREHPELAHERRLALLFLGRAWAYSSPASRSASWTPSPSTTPERLAEIGTRLQQALREAKEDDPSLVPALELVLAAIAAADGRLDAAAALASRVLQRFEGEGTITDEEPPRIFWVNARVAAARGAPRQALTAAWTAAVESLDRLVAPFDRKSRKRYLERGLSRAILVEAERAGLSLERNPTSHRISVAL